MNANDRHEFAEILNATLDVYGAKVTTASLSVWFAAMENYSLADVRRVMSGHVRNPGAGKFAPKPADLIGILQENDGRPGAEESWARLCRAIGDEGATVVLTDEERAAFFVADAIAQDKIAARMAFKETYAKAIHEARAAARPVAWSPILGHDPHERETVLIEAAEKGRLTAEFIAKLLPHRDAPNPRIVALLEAAKVPNRLAA